MDHVGTAAPAVRRPRCIGPQAFVFALSSWPSTWRTRSHQRSRRACPERCEEIPTSSSTLVFLKARALRAPEGPMESPPSPMRPGARSFVSFTKAAHSLLSPQRLQIDDRLDLHHPRRPLIDLPHPHFPIRATPIAEVVETPSPSRRSWSGSPEPSPLSPCHPEHCVKSLTTQTSLA